MIAWVVMPNHVHALFQTLPEWSMNTVVGSWKTFTTNAIGRIVRKSHKPLPRIWHPEFWDRFIRDQNHFAAALSYIHNNPVKARLQPAPKTGPGAAPETQNLGTRDSAPALQNPRVQSLACPAINTHEHRNLLPKIQPLRRRAWSGGEDAGVDQGFQ
ncbi:hypothetical protein JCM31598_07930 [Desulfonatronum parangueonense]